MLNARVEVGKLLKKKMEDPSFNISSNLEAKETIESIVNIITLDHAMSIKKLQ